MTTPTWSGPAVATESRTGSIITGNLIPQFVASTFVIARIISKAWIRRVWGHDDTMLCIAWTTSIALTILSCVQTMYGAGIHVDELPISALEANRKVQYASLLLYNLTLALTKITICLFYLNIFADPLNRRLTIAALIFILSYTIPLECVSIFQCNPIAANWDKQLAATCIPMMPHFWVSAACNMAADAWLVVQVIPNILPLQIPRRQKAVLLAVVSLGWLVIVASVIRVVRIQLVNDHRDFTWASYDVTIWSAVEVDVGLVCVAAPSTKPLFKKIAPEFLRSLTAEPGDADGGGATRYPLGTVRRGRKASGTLRLHSLDDAETGSVGRGWADVGGLLTTTVEAESKRGSVASGMGEIMKSVDVTVETTDLEQGSRMSQDSFRSSWNSNFRSDMRKI
ncbi:Integral membrane protein [Neofusicoccum parvum]|uniref:Integral membrane protein n=1 Tax=Neofusicoccum parvum TaxID=310453 RepID=A0ACB5SCF8_9PEZI|nr:Integral membrane protein [Neofusicoccum parvum]